MQERVKHAVAEAMEEEEGSHGGEETLASLSKPLGILRCRRNRIRNYEGSHSFLPLLLFWSLPFPVATTTLKIINLRKRPLLYRVQQDRSRAEG